MRLAALYNNARCCPSRAALLTGRYPHEVGVGAMTDIGVDIPAYQGHFTEHTSTVADLLRAKGYATYLSGKWHVGDSRQHWPERHGFDESFALIQGAASYFDFLPYRSDRWPPGNALTVVRNDRVVPPSDTGFYATDLYTDEAIGMLKDHGSDRPFFLYLAYTAPHWPLHAPPKDIARYAGSYAVGWDSIRQRRYASQLRSGLIDPQAALPPLHASVESESDWESLSDGERNTEARRMSVYAAMVDRMDQNIGRLVDQLKASGQADNTVIFFLSDNGAATAGNLAGGKYIHPRFDPEADLGGPRSFSGYGKRWAAVSNTPFRYYKGDIYGGGIASPFVAWYPKRIPSAAIDHTPAHIIDLLPTIDALSGPAPPAGGLPDRLPGRNLLPLLTGERKLGARTLYFEHMGNAGLIDGPWKLVRFRDEPWRLYNLENDRTETTDLADRYPRQVEVLHQRYGDWADSVGVLDWRIVQERIPYDF